MPAVLAALLLLAAAAPVLAQSPGQADVLLHFKATLTDPAGSLRDWTSVANSGPCLGGRRGNWTGVYCEDGKVIKLVLESMSLSGPLTFSSLAELPQLRSLSLMNNSFTGPLPSLSGLSGLRSLYLARNHLSGDIPADAFLGMNSLRALYLQHNSFAGAVPASLAALPILTLLNLQENTFSGRLPEFKNARNLKLNVSYNRLEGPVPASLSHVPAGSFVGNVALCGNVLGIPCAASSNPSSGHRPAIWVAVAVIFMGVTALVITCRRMRRLQQLEEPQLGQPASSANKKPSSSAPGNGGRDPEPETKLVILREGPVKLEVHTLLSAQAEIMSKNKQRPAYKVVLPGGQAMVVKRYKELNFLMPAEFEEHMHRLGAISHPNLLPLLAYHQRNKEKLIVTEYVPNGSLRDLVHGKDRPDWATRLRILKGVARGLVHLCRELPMLTTPHGSLKASNVLLDDAMQPLLVEYGLSPALNPGHTVAALAVHHTPEYQLNGTPTKKSDVWTLGVLILEVLTGKDPNPQTSGGDSDSAADVKNGSAELAAWAESMVRENREDELFDETMAAAGSATSDMRKLLHVALACCEPDIGDRCDATEAMNRIDELRDV